MKLAHAVTFLSGAGFPHSLQGGRQGTPFIKVSDLAAAGPHEEADGASNYVTEDQLKELRANVAPAGAVLLPKIGAAIAGRHRRVRIARRAAFDNNVLALVPRRVDPRYLTYWLSQVDLAPVTNPGAVASLDMNAFRALRLPDIDLDTQRKIADVLDRELERLAELRSKTQRLQELREEMHTAALAEQLLLTDHPRVQIRYVARTGTGHTPSRTHAGYWLPEECVIPWFTLADVWQIRDDARELVGETVERISPLGIASSSTVVLPAGTVLLSRTASVGFSAVMGVDMAVSQDFMTWTCGERLDPYFLLYALRAMRPELRRLMMGSTHKTIYMPDLHALRCPLPPIDQQQAMVARARREGTINQRLREQIATLSARLDEYRDCVIRETVRGDRRLLGASDAHRDERAHAALEGAVL